MSRSVVALAGGTGSAKLLRGLSWLGRDLTVIANVGDNVWMYGLYICPDLDIATYTLAGKADEKRGWGIEGDTRVVLDELARLGVKTWFNLGDRDMALCLTRTLRMVSGESLTKATEHLCTRLGVRQKILPATDDPIETYVLTTGGEMHLQEFWVKNGGRPRVRGVKYRGASRAAPTAEVESAIEGADRILLCPANPVTSIGPITAIRGLARMLRNSGARKVALSPMVGGSPVSGPARKLMKACGIRPNSAGVAELYRGFVDAMIIDRRDASLRREILSMGLDCSLSDIVVRGPGDRRRMAMEMLAA